MAFRIQTRAQLKRFAHLLPKDELKKLSRSVSRRGPSPPQQKLWEIVKARYPTAEQEKYGLVPGRRYTVDIVIEEFKLIIELDGWAYHAKYKQGFKRDRQKDRLLMLAGYRVVRVAAGEVLKNEAGVIDVLERIVEMIKKERRAAP